jgi:hypothetical protein
LPLPPAQLSHGGKPCCASTDVRQARGEAGGALQVSHREISTQKVPWGLYVPEGPKQVLKQRGSKKQSKEGLKYAQATRLQKTDDPWRAQQPARRPGFQWDDWSRGGRGSAFPEGVSHGESLRGRRGAGFAFPQVWWLSIGLAIQKGQC